MDADPEDKVTVFTGKIPTLYFLSLLLFALILFICGFFFGCSHCEAIGDRRSPLLEKTFGKWRRVFQAFA
jgi:hypothetical protein